MSLIPAFDHIDHSTIRPFDYSIIRLFDHSIIRLFDYSIIRLFVYSTIRLFDYSIIRSFDYFFSLGSGAVPLFWFRRGNFGMNGFVASFPPASGMFGV